MPVENSRANDEAELHVSLDRPPQAHSLTVRALLQRVQGGGIRVPQFQRPLRWRATDIVKLFDSLRRGYPTGSLLFWRRPAEADEHYTLGNVIMPVPANSDAWWIVDGQQRVTALAAALLDLKHLPNSPWLVKFNPETGEFSSGPVHPEEEGRVIPLNSLGDLRRLGRWLRDCTLSSEQQDILEATQQRILDYELTSYLMETDKPDALRGVFARMNSSGVRMRSDEVFQALLGAPELSSRRVDLNELQAACDIDGFGQPPRGEILKAVLAMSGQDPTRRPESLKDDVLGSLVNAEEAKAALIRTVVFLMSDHQRTSPSPGAGIPYYGFIPFPVTFVILARWFYVFQESDHATLVELSRWVWRAVLTASHQRGAVSALREQTRLITSHESSQQVVLESLQRATGSPKHADWTLRRFHTKNARSRVEILALLAQKPMYRDGSAVSWRELVTEGERVAREILRTGELQKSGDPTTKALAHTVANRALLNTQHTGLKTEFQKWNATEDAAALRSHVIFEEDLSLLKSESGAADFLTRRAARLQAIVSEFLSLRAGLKAPTIAPLSAYVDSDPLLDDESQ